MEIMFCFCLQILFHYQTRKCDDAKTVIDDSRKHVDSQPMQLVTGKKFKMEVWEACLSTMLKGEIASFTVDPMVSCVSLHDFLFPLIKLDLVLVIDSG